MPTTTTSTTPALNAKHYLQSITLPDDFSIPLQIPADFAAIPEQNLSIPTPHQTPLPPHPAPLTDPPPPPDPFIVHRSTFIVFPSTPRPHARQ